jgi:hypothetical protein
MLDEHFGISVVEYMAAGERPSDLEPGMELGQPSCVMQGWSCQYDAVDMGVKALLCDRRLVFTNMMQLA